MLRATHLELRKVQQRYAPRLLITQSTGWAWQLRPAAPVLWPKGWPGV